MNPHLATPILRAGAAPRPGGAAAILLHGRDRTPEEMIALAERIALPELAWVAPTADGATWYPGSFLAPLGDNEPRLGFARARIEQLVADLAERGVPRTRIALVGFSQGACVLAEHAFRSGGRWGALVAFTGGLFGPPGTTWSTERRLAGTPVFLSGSDGDTWVPVARVRETRDVFTAMGATVECLTYAGESHVVTDAEIDRAHAILNGMVNHG